MKKSSAIPHSRKTRVKPHFRRTRKTDARLELDAELTGIEHDFGSACRKNTSTLLSSKASQNASKSYKTQTFSVRLKSIRALF